MKNISNLSYKMLIRKDNLHGKTKEELNELKIEYESLNEKLK